jgi:hypothetical protein
MEKKWILLPKVLIDNSAVEGFGEGAKSVYDQKSRKSY